MGGLQNFGHNCRRKIAQTMKPKPLQTPARHPLSALPGSVWARNMEPQPGSASGMCVSTTSWKQCFRPFILCNGLSLQVSRNSYCPWTVPCSCVQCRCSHISAWQFLAFQPSASCTEGAECALQPWEACCQGPGKCRVRGSRRSGYRHGISFVRRYRKEFNA